MAHYRSLLAISHNPYAERPKILWDALDVGKDDKIDGKGLDALKRKIGRTRGSQVKVK